MTGIIYAAIAIVVISIGLAFMCRALNDRWPWEL